MFFSSQNLLFWKMRAFSQSSWLQEICFCTHIYFFYVKYIIHNNNNNNNNNNNQQKKRICKIVDFAAMADHRINLKESEKNDNYLDLAWELKKLWNMKVTIAPFVIGALGTITKGLLKDLEDLEVGEQVETIKRQHC